MLISVQAINPIIAPLPGVSMEKEIDQIIDKLVSCDLQKKEITENEERINLLIYDVLKLSCDEIDFIENQ